MKGRGQTKEAGGGVWVHELRQERYLRDEAVHVLFVLCPRKSDTIHSSVGRDEAGNSFVARGGNAKVPGHGVQLFMEMLQAVNDLGVLMIHVGCTR